jgi:hypothetical protein
MAGLVLGQPKVTAKITKAATITDKKVAVSAGMQLSLHRMMKDAFACRARH